MRAELGLRRLAAQPSALAADTGMDRPRARRGAWSRSLWIGAVLVGVWLLAAPLISDAEFDALYNELKAIEAGCRHIDTALSSWSGGTSHPPTETLVMALQDTDHDTGLSLQKLQEVNDYFAQIRKKYHRFESEFTGVDTLSLIHI